jgi:hypothetical protein
VFIAYAGTGRSTLRANPSSLRASKSSLRHVVVGIPTNFS